MGFGTSTVVFLCVLGALYGLARIHHLWSIIKGFEADREVDELIEARTDELIRASRQAEAEGDRPPVQHIPGWDV